MVSANCYLCNTDYKVSEFHGKPVCHGFCRRKLENKLEKEASSAAPPTAAGDGPAAAATTTAASPQPQQQPQQKQLSASSQPRASSWQVGGCCRAACPDADNELLEAVIVAVSPDGTKVKVTFVGRGDTPVKVHTRDLAPSRGKGARDRQASGGGGGGGGVKESGDYDTTLSSSAKWRVGDKCIAVFSEDGVEYKAEIMSIEGKNCVVKYTEYGNSETKTLEELKPMPAKPKVGDIVRAVFSDDGNEYDAEVTFIGESEGHEYATVKFVGYGNEEQVWLNELKPSKTAEKVEPAQTAVTGNKEETPEVEDASIATTPHPSTTTSKRDTAVKEEENPAIAPAVSAAASDEKDEDKTTTWQVGDYCRVVYSEDGNEYEGQVTSAGESEGHNYYVVKFLGYGNEESIWSNGMMSSKGPEERKAQLAACGVEEEEEEEVAASEQPSPVEQQQSSNDKPPVVVAAEQQETANIKSAPAAGEEAIKTVANADSTVGSPPPTKDAPPPKEWQVGAPCRAVFAEDGAEYEADLTAIQTEDCGNKSATVVFVGYGNTEQVWLDDLLESKPEERKAVLESFGMTTEAEKAAEAEAEAPKATPPPSKEKPATTEPVQAEAASSQPQPPSDQMLLKVKTGDFCRVVYQGPERPDLCGTELEGMVFSVDGDKTTVRILGIHSVYQKEVTGGLKETGGSRKREDQIMRFQNEKTTPATKGAQQQTANSASASAALPSLSPLAASVTDVNHGVTVIHELVNKLSSELDLKGTNQDLLKRVMRLEASNQALNEQIDVIRSGNINLLHQLQTNSRAVEQNGKITDAQYQDTMKVFAKNLENERNRYLEMERKYAHTIETTAADEKVLLAKIEALKQDVQRQKRENLLIKQEKQELVNEIVTLKARNLVQ